MLMCVDNTRHTAAILKGAVAAVLATLPSNPLREMSNHLA